MRRIAPGLAASLVMLLVVFSGQAQATTTSPRPEVLGLGDSVMSGHHCGCDGIPVMFARRVTWKTGVAVDAVNDGVNGATTTSLLADLDTQRYDDAVSSATVVLIDIGANDLYPALDAWRNGGCSSSCYQPMIRRMGARLGQILNRVNALRRGHSEVMVATYWNVFQDGADIAKARGDKYIWWSRALTRAANQVICSTAVDKGTKCVPLYAPFIRDTNGDPTRYLADDGDHPNYRGTLLIVHQFLDDTRFKMFG